MSTHANMVWATAASPGTGPITVSTAVSGYRTFAQGYNSADATVAGIRIEDASDPTIWEVANNCTYTHSGTTLSRGTFENSSTGSLVNFTGAVVVSVVATAMFGNNAALNHVAGGDADTTMAVGNMYVTDMSGWATAARTYTLPAAAAVGDRIGIMVTAGGASHELIIKPNTGDTINGGSAAAEWSRLFITGEVVILRCVTADSAWIVEYDGRIQSFGILWLTTDCDGETSNVWTLPTSAATPGAWTEQDSRGVGITTASGRITIRRAGNYLSRVRARNKDSFPGDGQFGCAVWKNGATIINNLVLVGSACTIQNVYASHVTQFDSGDYVQLYYNTGAGGIGLRGTLGITAIEVMEQLQ